MSRFEGITERERVLPAVSAAIAVFAYTLVVQFLLSVFYATTMLLQGQGLRSEAFGAFLSAEYLLTVLAFSVGVFAWLWLFQPLSAGLQLRRVIGASLLAVVSGAVLTAIVSFGIQMQAWLAGADFFSNSLRQATESFGRDGGNAIALALSSTAQVAVGALPLTVLAVVLTWSWLVRHPASQRDLAAAVEV